MLAEISCFISATCLRLLNQFTKINLITKKC